ncbi:MAG: thioesterase [Oscillospiraceae bacterium]|nr:thioesterase [Oscillospiraceae bacterium]
MDGLLEKDLIILSSVTDAQGEHSIPAIFDLFEDLAAEHAERLGVGIWDMAQRRTYWVAVRTRVRIYRRARMMETVHVQSWPNVPGAVKDDRNYRIKKGEEVLAEGRTEWIVQNMDSGRMVKPEDSGYPLNMEHWPEKMCPGPFTRFRETPAAENLVKTYTIGSQDIDTGRHMNNVAYIRMLLGTFTTAELADMPVREVEVAYRVACFEGQTLSIYRRRDEEGWHFLVQNPDGETALQAVLRL